MSVDPRTRHTRRNPCKVCGGWDDPRLRGTGSRCYGFDSDDGAWCWCTRPEKAGPLPFHDGAQAYCHYMEGACRCGAEHAPAPVALPENPSWFRRTLGRYSAPAGVVDCCYPYFGLDGRPIHRTVRYRDPKEFRQERYVGGQWRPGLRGVTTVLYRLPQLLNSTPSPVYVTEGEKDAERLASLGLVATCAPSGCAWKLHYAQWLNDRDVTILQDNDEAGRRRAERLFSQLLSVCTGVRIIAFDHMSEGADVSDWLDAGGAVDELTRHAGRSLRGVAV